MKILKCEKCSEIFFEDDGSVGDHRSYEQYICSDCSDEHKEEIRRYEGKKGGRPNGIPAIQHKRGDEPWAYISSSYIFGDDAAANTEIKKLRAEAKKEGWNIKYRIVRGSIVPV
jgi:hypothetical protein